MITALLQQDGRLSSAALAARVGLSVSAANDRLRKLRARGVITGWAVRVDPAAVGLDLLAFVFVALEAPRHDGPFRQAMMAAPAVMECHHVTGPWNHLLKLRAADPTDLEWVLTTQAGNQPGVTRTETLIVMSSAKETTTLPVAPAAGEDGA